MKIVGNTVGTSLPKPDLRQTDPRKGDFVKGKEEFLQNSGGNADVTIDGETLVISDNTASIENETLIL